MTTAERKPNLTSTTHVVHIVDYGSRKISKYDNGFKFVDFSDVQVDRLFGLGLAAFSGSELPPAIISEALPAPDFS
ncbi:hypothetical protein TWF694_005273 [Orbilia ellipsospora]|uniref:Uncharacterized protein n=1 Tax=Orbilia ellipsospora TaxID=2528407 RepID=A0AAV9WSL8_9PEZI